MLDFELGRIARLELDQDLGEVAGRRGRLTVDRQDQIAGLHSGLLGGRAGSDGIDPDAVVGIHELHAQICPTRTCHMTARDQLVGDGAGAIARDREADAGSAAADLRIGRGQRRNADDLTFEVDERAAAVAGVDRCAGLDHVGQAVSGRFGNLPAQSADDAFGHARLKPERVAHGEHEVAHRQCTRVPEDGRLETRCSDLDNGYVIGRKRADQGAVVDLAVGESDLEGLRSPNHVGVRHDVSRGVVDDAGSEARTRLDHHHRRCELFDDRDHRGLQGKCVAGAARDRKARLGGRRGGRSKRQVGGYRRRIGIGVRQNASGQGLRRRDRRRSARGRSDRHGDKECNRSGEAAPAPLRIDHGRDLQWFARFHELFAGDILGPLTEESLNAAPGGKTTRPALATGRTSAQSLKQTDSKT